MAMCIISLVVAMIVALYFVVILLLLKLFQPVEALFAQIYTHQMQYIGVLMEVKFVLVVSFPSMMNV